MAVIYVTYIEEFYGCEMCVVDIKLVSSDMGS